MVCGADNQIRTGDLFLTKEVLYLLSHISIVSKLAKNARILTVFSLLLIWPKVIDGILTKAVRYRLCHISASNGVALLLLRLTRSPSSIGCGGRIWTIRPSGYEPDELPDCSTPRYKCARFPDCFTILLYSGKNVNGFFVITSKARSFLFFTAFVYIYITFCLL